MTRIPICVYRETFELWPNKIPSHLCIFFGPKRERKHDKNAKMPTIIKGERGRAKEQKNENLGMIVRESEKGADFQRCCFTFARENHDWLGQAPAV